MSISTDDHIGAAMFSRVQNISVLLVSDFPRFRLTDKLDDKTDPLEASYQDVQGRMRNTGSEIRGLADNAPYLGRKRFANENFELPRESPANDFARSTRRIRF